MPLFLELPRDFERLRKPELLLKKDLTLSVNR